MDFKDLLKVNDKRFLDMVMILSMIGIISISLITINYSSNNFVNNAFAQSANTTNGTTNSDNSTNNNMTGQQQQQSQISSVSNFTRSLGSISSIQNNETGKPSWILSGQWDLAIPKPLKINQTNPPNAAIFNAGFEMIKTDGKSMHKHMISDFKLAGSAINGNALVLSGTATITMKEGPVKEVPISISILNQGALKLWIDPEKTTNHFGNTPIYGTVSSVGVFLSFP